MDIPLQEKSAGKGYAKVALDDYEKDETNNEDDIPLQEGAIVAHVSINDGSADNDDDKETLLVEEGKKPEAASTGLPWRLLLSVYFIVWTESAVMNGFNPIIPGMCKDRFKMSEDIVSIASGFLVGGYIFATFLSSFFLGHLSDIFGRQKFMLLGSGMGAICSVGFGLAPWYWLAFLLRFIAGLCNANNALTRAVISDVVPRGPRRAQAYGYHGATVSFARAFSSALSGLTSEVILDPSNPLLDDRYFLPAMFAASLQTAAFALNILFVPESNKKAVKSLSDVNSGDSSDSSSGEKKEQRSLSAGIKEIRSDRLMMKLILSNCLSSFGNGAMLLAIVLYFSLDIDKYGLGMSAFQNGILFGWFGLAGVIFQIICFKWLLKKRGILWLFQFGNMSLAIGCILMPATSIIYAYFGVTTATTVISWIIAGFFCCILATGFMTCLPVITTMINNCANADRQGLISGTAQSLSSFLRAFGPTVSFSFLIRSVAIKMPFLLFVFLSATYLSSYCLLKFGISRDEKSRIGETDRG